MNRLLTGVLAAGLLLALSPFPARAQSQHEMNEQADRDFVAADKDLNGVYKRLVAILDAQARKNLQASQRAWIVFRDAEAELHADLSARGGSIYPMDYAEQRTELTKARTKELRDLLAAQSQ